MAIKWLSKDPDEVLDYRHDWSALLADNEDVAGQPGCEVPADSGLVVDSTSMDGAFQTVWLSGGNVGSHKLTLSITTTGGRVFEEGVTLPVKER